MSLRISFNLLFVANVAFRELGGYHDNLKTALLVNKLKLSEKWRRPPSPLQGMVLSSLDDMAFSR